MIANKKIKALSDPPYCNVYNINNKSSNLSFNLKFLSETDSSMWYKLFRYMGNVMSGRLKGHYKHSIEG